MYTIPFNLYLNKKHTRIGIFMLVALALLLAFASKYSFRAGGLQPAAFLSLLLCCAAIVSLLIRQFRILRRQAPLITMTPEGIGFSGKAFEAIGIVRWDDIMICMDTELGWNNERYLLIKVYNPDVYIKRIGNEKTRKVFEKERRRHNALLWARISHLDGDVVMLKRTVFRMMESARSYSY